MVLRAFALLMGVVFGLVGILGFTPGAVHSVPMDSPALVVDEGYGLLLGLFPVNVLHNFVRTFVYHPQDGSPPYAVVGYTGVGWALSGALCATDSVTDTSMSTGAPQR